MGMYVIANITTAERMTGLVSIEHVALSGIDLREFKRMAVNTTSSLWAIYSRRV